MGQQRTDSQARIAELIAQIPEGSATEDAVADLERVHTHLLYLGSRIQVGARWGSHTTYTVKVRDRDVVEITNGALEPLPNGQGAYRVEFGANVRGETHARLEYWEPAPLYQWDAWDDSDTPERVWEWLRKFHPVAEALLEIDVRLLSMKQTTNNPEP